MTIGETLYVRHRGEWRKWLRAHFRNKSEIWLVLPNKASAKPCIEYNDAVEEALCFGWIDSIRKKLTVDEAAQRYTPRRAGGSYSQPNKERLKRLLEGGRVHPAIREDAKAAVRRPFVFPPDIVRSLQRDRPGWAWFRRQSGPYRRIRVAYVHAARGRPAEFAKRLRNLMEANRAGRILGYGGIDQYY